MGFDIAERVPAPIAARAARSAEPPGRHGAIAASDLRGCGGGCKAGDVYTLPMGFAF